MLPARFSRFIHVRADATHWVCLRSKALGTILAAVSALPLARGQTNSLDHFAWIAVPASSQVGQPFPVIIEARDASDSPVTNFSGVVTLTEMVPGKPPGLLLTEVETANAHRAEISNLSSNSIDASGWRLVFYDLQSWPLPKVSLTIPAGTICPSLGVFQVRDSGTSLGTYPVFSTPIGLSWNRSPSTPNQQAVALLDAAGNLVDFFCANAAYPSQVLVPVAIGSNSWSGPPVVLNVNPALTYQRWGHAAHYNAGDWLVTTNSIGLLNTNLEFPVVATPLSTPLSPGAVTLTNGLWSGQLSAPLAGTNVLLQADNGLGAAGDSALIVISNLPGLTLQVPHQAFKTNAGYLGQATVAIPSPLSTNLNVAMTSGAPTLITLPSVVTVLAGSTNASFNVTNWDDGLVEGPKPVTVLASAAGFGPASDVVTNYDRPPVTLTVSLPSSFAEATTWLPGSVSASTQVAANVAVKLTSSNTNKVLVPDFVVIPAGQSSASFGLASIYNPLIEGDIAVTITASVPGWTSGFAATLVKDAQFATISVSIPYVVNEGVGVMTNAGTITIGGILATDLVVTLTNTFPASLRVPATVLIPAGQSSATFNLVVPEDGLMTGDQYGWLYASAPGFFAGSHHLSIVDDEVASFSFGSIPNALLGGQPLTITVYALNLSGTVAPYYSGTIGLRATNASGTVAISPSSVGPFTNGVWSGVVQLTGENRGVVLTADDGLGHTGRSAALDVVAGYAVNLPISDIAWDATRNKLWAGIKSGGSNSQSVALIDPATGVLGPVIAIGGDPGKLALSDDGQFLYVAQMTTGGVVRVNLNLGSVDLQFTPLSVSNTFITEMAVPPGDAHKLVVQLSGSGGGTSVCLDGATLTNGVAPADYVSANDYHFIFADSRSNFFSIYPGVSRWENINSGGVTLVREVGDSHYDGAFVYAAGMFFGANGNVFDPQNFRYLGAYPSNGPVVVDANAGQVFFVSGSSLLAFHLLDSTAMGQIALPIPNGAATRLLWCGSNVLAVASTNLLFVQATMVRQQATADVSLLQTASATTGFVGSNLTYSIIVSNAGPASATNVELIDLLPADTVVLSSNASVGAWLLTNGLLSLTIGNLSSGSSVSAQFTVQLLTPGQLMNSAWVAGDGVNLANSSSRLTNTVVFGSVLPAVTRLWFNSDALAYDTARNRLWASVERFAGVAERSLHAIEMSNGLAGPSVQMGYPIGVFALSSDQNYLYVMYVNDQDHLNYTPDNYIRRVNLSSNVIDEDFLVTDSVGQEAAAIDMVGISSYPSGIVVARANVNDDIGLYNNGSAIARTPIATAGKLEINPAIPTRFYSLQWAYTGDTVRRLNIGSGSISVLTATNLFNSAHDYKYGAGYLFADNGIVADAEGLFPVAQLPVAGLVRTDDTSGNVFYLAQNGAQWTLNAFDENSFALLWTYVVPGVLGTPSYLIKCAPGLLAFRTDSEQIFILNPSLMPHALSADLQMAATTSTTSAQVNDSVTFTSTVINNGPAPARNVIVTNLFPADAVIFNVSSSQGVVTTHSNVVVGILGDLPAASSAWVQVVATWRHGGTLTNMASVSDSIPDPVVTNNYTSAAVQFNAPPFSDLAISHLAPAVSGSNLLFTLVVSNSGPDTASNVWISDSFDAGGALVSATPSAGAVSLSGNSASANIGALSNGASATLTLLIGPCCGEVIFNQAQTGSDSQDPNPLNNYASTSVSLSGQVIVEDVPVPAMDIAYDGTRQRILAALAAPLGSITQSIMGIDVQSRAISQVAKIGNSLRAIAVSDDGLYAYTGIADTGGVARVDLNLGAVDLRFALNTPDAPFYPYVANGLAVLPGNSTSIAAARSGDYANYYSGLAVFDNGVQRPDAIEAGAGADGYSIAFLDATNLCAMDRSVFQLASLTPTGMTNYFPIMGGYGGGIFAAEGGLVFTSSGQVLDPKAGTLVGTFPASGWVATDLARNRVYFLTGSTLLRAFDATTHGELWSIRLNTAAISAFIRLATNGLAFTTSDLRLYIINPAQLDTPSSDLSISQTASANPVTVGTPVTFTTAFQNFGPWTATGVVISNPLPANATFLSATSSVGTCLFTNGAVLCNLGSLANGFQGSVLLTFLPIAPGTLTNQAAILLNEPDANPTNNTSIAGVFVAPQPSVAIRDATAIQGINARATISFPLSLSRASSVPVYLGFRSADGTAVAGQDYDSTNGLVTVPAGTTSSQINLAIISTNPAVSLSSFFYLNLTAATNGTLAKTQAVGTIIKRVFETVSISSTSVVAGASGLANAMFQVSLNQTSASSVAVSYQTLDGSATAGTDYLARDGVLVFSPGITNLLLAVPVYGTTVWQPIRIFSVVLSQPQNAVLGTNEASGTILNTNPVPALVILTPLRSQTVAPGAGASFSVTATGNPLPLTYQWQFDGGRLVGATNNSLTLTNIQQSNAGNYTVAITNAVGTSTNVSAGLSVLPLLSFIVTNHNLVLIWAGPYILQSATNVAGLYRDVPGASSPYTNWLGADPSRFFRLRASINGSLFGNRAPGGQFIISVSGFPGYTYVLQTSTNLKNWVSLQTNPAPFQFQDASAASFPARFYRTALP